jgi:hydroxymethylpyrimidine/phosphomethylpyrimidine kinase
MILAMTTAQPVCLTIAGSDCSGGAGIQADLKTFSRLDVYGTSAVTSVVAETPLRVSRITPLSPERVVEQAAMVLDDFPVAAVKTGMLGSRALVAALAKWWGGLRKRPKLVVDPVLVATTGDPLMGKGGLKAMAEEWIPYADLVTPNMDEMYALLSIRDHRKSWENESGKALAREAWERWKVPFLITGGDAVRDWSTDILVDRVGTGEFRAKRIHGGPFHGTGCTLSAAITAHLAWGRDRITAIRRAKRYISRALKDSHRYRKMRCLNHGA